jgi:hypothetical protein
MTKRIVWASAVVCLFPLSFLMGTESAVAKQCNAAMPSKPKAHWTYRLIDGRKCWYEGRNSIPKSLLSWSGSASPSEKASSEKTSRDKASREKASVRLEKEKAAPSKEAAAREAMAAIPERPASVPDQGACCNAVSETTYTFEARWRGLSSRD